MAAEQQTKASQSAGSWQPGLIALHGNKTEALADTVLAWLAANPLQALEPEIVLVQSNGMAEWFKMRMAEHQACARRPRWSCRRALSGAVTADSRQA